MGPKPKRGISAEEKRTRLLNWIRKSRSVFSNKTIEKASKPTGISTMIIKSVLQELNDDNFIDKDKIGSSTYYWAFPSKLSQEITTTLADLQKQLGTLRAEVAQAHSDLEEAKVGREDTPERTAVIKQRRLLMASKSELQGQLAEISRNDPAVFKAKKEALSVAIEQANLWTDNIYCLKTFLMDKFGLEAKAVDKVLHITAAFDYVEEPK
eukprot:gnl/Dysnectes_brevis/2106_a2443_1758.p1 GENE.gnl/Dysnectes_brevis/2106_a2443_1758~~gnl/Dysnectes_brevis/2106_a2443_1758.p1  ORF type:complete len:210 (-),score=58.45 gnl/Dysnectes_brevis/2106_a2443_1758:68-697(-)